MYKGEVTFTATIQGTPFKFERLEYDPHVQGVEKLALEAPNGTDIALSVHLSAVATHDDGRKLANHIGRDALHQLCFWRDLAIGNSRQTGETFEDLNAPPGHHVISAGINLHIGGHAEIVVTVPPATIKAYLEQPLRPGQRHYHFFRSALLSESPIEEFTHLYTILLNFYDDEQVDVDAFIVSEQPNVAQSQQPPTRRRPRPGRNETVYTRLRNELAHRRPGVDMENTKAQATNHLPSLRTLVKRAIELHP